MFAQNIMEKVHASSEVANSRLSSNQGSIWCCTWHSKSSPFTQPSSTCIQSVWGDTFLVQQIHPSLCDIPWIGFWSLEPPGVEDAYLPNLHDLSVARCVYPLLLRLILQYLFAHGVRWVLKFETSWISHRNSWQEVCQVEIGPCLLAQTQNYERLCVWDILDYERWGCLTRGHV